MRESIHAGFRLMLIPGSQLLVYPLLWMLMPPETEVAGEARG